MKLVLLAAGASRRMRGADKLLEPVDDEPLLRRQARAALASGVGPVAVSCGSNFGGLLVPLVKIMTATCSAYVWASGKCSRISSSAGIGTLSL